MTSKQIWKLAYSTARELRYYGAGYEGQITAEFWANDNHVRLALDGRRIKVTMGVYGDRYSSVYPVNVANWIVNPVIRKGM